MCDQHELSRPTLGNLTFEERVLVTKEFPYCDGVTVSSDVVLVFPTQYFRRHGNGVCERLQHAYDFLVQATPVAVTPTEKFGHRAIIGYRHRDHEPNNKDCQAGWVESQHRVNVPWPRLRELEREPFVVPLSDQSEFVCSHELCHPLETIFLEDNVNKHWKESFCDLLRAFVLEVMGLAAHATAWRNVISQASVQQTGDEYHDGVGRILTWCEQTFGLRSNIDAPRLREAIATLISLPITPILDPLGTIHFGG